MAEPLGDGIERDVILARIALKQIDQLNLLTEKGTSKNPLRGQISRLWCSLYTG
jgi:hypothetical protein